MCPVSTSLNLFYGGDHDTINNYLKLIPSEIYIMDFVTPNFDFNCQ